MDPMNSDPVYLDRNESLFGPAPACFEALRDIISEEMSCYTRAYSKGIKSVLSERLAELHNVPEEQVLLGYGSEDLLKQVLHCYLAAGDFLMKPELSWWYYDSVASEVHAKTIQFPLRRKDEEFSFGEDLLLQAYRNVLPRVLLISSPNNPTGNSMSVGQLERVLEQTRNSVVVLDQAYFGYNPAADINLTRFVQRFPNLIVLRTFSKYYGLAGMRVGYAIVGNDLKDIISFSKKYLGYHRISEAVAMAALNSGEYYEGIRLLIEAEKRRYYAQLNGFDGVTVYRSDANFVLIRYPVTADKDLQAACKAEKLIVKFFKDDDPNLLNHVRITIGKPEQNSRLMRVIRSVVSKRVAVST